MSRIKLYLLIVLFITAISPSIIFASNQRNSKIQTSVIQGVVQSCHDGDTCRVLVEKVPVSQSEILKVRLSGIDAPEIKQTDGVKAKNFLELLVAKQKVRLECQGKSFDRVTCKMFVNVLNVNAEMVKNGWAWDAPKHSKGAYRNLQNAAKTAKLGLWKSKDAISPYCFRSKKNKTCKTNPNYMN